MSKSMRLMCLTCFLTLTVVAKQSSTVCGANGYPTASINLGQTSANTIQFGSPVGLILAGSGYGAVLQGCRPSAAATGLQQVSQLNFEYNDHGFITKALSNDTANLGSYEVEYEVAPPNMSSSFPVRVSHVLIMGIDGSRQTSNFSYDTKGRLSHVAHTLINVTSHGVPFRRTTASSRALPFRAGVSGDPRLPLHLEKTLTGSRNMSTSIGSEYYAYDDPEHPDQPTLYKSTGCLGEAAMVYEYRTQAHQMRNISRSAYMPSSHCDPKCGANTFCCASAGAPAQNAWCSSKACTAMGHSWAYAYSDAGDVAAVQVDGQASQAFVYTADSALRAIQQNVTTKSGTKVVNMLESLYDTDGRIQGLIAFVVYPFLPEGWGFLH